MSFEKRVNDEKREVKKRSGGEEKGRGVPTPRYECELVAYRRNLIM